MERKFHFTVKGDVHSSRVLMDGKSVPYCTAFTISQQVCHAPRAIVEVLLPTAEVDCSGELFGVHDGKRYRLVRGHNWLVKAFRAVRYWLNEVTHER